MAGTKLGAVKARDKNLAKDPDWYRKMGAIGGRALVPKGFASDRGRAMEAGRKGGLKRIENLRRKQNED